jgi:hypothetical protein
MDGDRIFRKTTTGVASFARTSMGLNQAQRGLLIMIDGKRTMADLRKLAAVFGDCDALVKQILELGMIEPVPAATTMSAGAAMSDTAIAAANVALAKMTSESQLATARAATAKYIADTMGPMGDKLSLAIERSKTLAELKQSVDTAAIVLEDLKGVTVAKELQTLFASRLL